ncbi:MAG: hypothetical protein PUA75_11395 [Clostridiales bacterium]|nr:hypothetical protein [Clostridiales bacterium]
MSASKKIIVYTDGSALNNGNSERETCCGWAYKLIDKDGNEWKASGGDTGKTNNWMEMTAVLNAMQAVTDKSVPVEVYSDSQYVVETMNGIIKIYENKEFWAELMAEKENFKSIFFHWVKGHDKNEHNNEVDNMARQEAENVKKCK